MESTLPSVVVLSTLHKHHEDVAGYGFDELRRILIGLSPDQVFAEVTETDLAERRDEPFKREYPEVLYPYLTEFTNVRAHALEPSGPQRTEMLEKHRSAAREFELCNRFAEFETYLESWLQQLMTRFRTAAELNSKAADDAVREKQEYQATLYPPQYTQAWAEWNQHFHDRIVQTVEATRPRLAVVLVGLEHSYWLRPRLGARSDLALLDAMEAIERL